MLECKNLVKDYQTSNEVVHALKGVSVTFRDNEFVSILGQSGCGKTTFLNIIGGLDHYTSGDLIINGKSTKDYSDKDWDTYRNHRVGFVFQSYNLIMHQSVLSNVELALTLTGVGKEERRQRAIEVLEKVGLKDQLDKKPTQMSGGQMQRVAIARALVNNPDILLADEPTGALDSVTSVQIMDLLQEIAKDRLVIMVTHNPDLAKQYSTRIIRLLDGEIQSDSDPVSEQEKIDVSQENLAKPSMSFKTALSLSLNNLMTKKGRTFLTSFAGSIGIIGIALILSLSNGVQTYINTVENDTMASYPIEIQDNSMDMSAMMSAMMEMHSDESVNDTDNITSRPYVNDILNSLSSEESNNLTAFKAYLDSKEGKEFVKNTKAIEYDYSITPIIYNDNGDKGLIQVSPNGLLERLGFSDMMSLQNQFMSSSTTMANNEVWTKLPTSSVLRDEEYELVNGEWANDYNEVVLAVDENNQITDYALYSLGLMDQDELVNNYNQLLNGNIEKIETSDTVSYTPEEILNMSFKLVLPSDLYRESNGVWIDQSDDEEFVQNVVDNALEVKVVGIIKPKDSSVKRMTMGGVMYTDDMQDYIIEQFSNVPVYNMKPLIRNLLRMSVYQLKYMDSVPDSAVCNEAVKIAQRRGFYNLKGFVNGVLRNTARRLSQVKYPDENLDPLHYLSVRYSFPIWMLDKWMQQFGYETTEKICRDTHMKKGTVVRCDLQKASKEEIIEELKKDGASVREHPYLDYALVLSDYNYIGALSAFKKGWITVQDISSMLVAEVAAPNWGDYCIDVCAAPGGKSLHIAEKLMGSGYVEARDVSERKVALMQENIERTEAINIRAAVWDATVRDPESVKKADIVLADVPCSGLGVIGKKQDIKYKMSEKRQQDIIRLQRRILSVVQEYVRPNGVLIYSTCTIGADENQYNLKWFLENYPFRLESIDPYICEELKGKTTAGGYIQLLPGVHESDGFFIARLRRLKEEE